MAYSSLRTGLLTCSFCLLLISANTLGGEARRPQAARAPAATGLASPEKSRSICARPLRCVGRTKVTAEPLDKFAIPDVSSRRRYLR